MIIFVIFLIIIIILIGIASSFGNSSNTSSLNEISKTEMMSEMYKDITGNKLDPIEKNFYLCTIKKTIKNEICKVNKRTEERKGEEL